MCFDEMATAEVKRGVSEGTVTHHKHRYGDGELTGGDGTSKLAIAKARLWLNVGLAVG